MWRILIAATAVLILTSSCNDDGDTGDREQELRTTVEGAFDAFREARTDDFYEYFSEDFHDRCDLSDFRRVMAIAAVFLGELEGGDLSIESVTFEDDDHATLTLKFEAGEQLDDEPGDFELTDTEGFLDVWVREDSEWKTNIDQDDPCELSSSSDDDDSDDDDAKTPTATGPGTSRDDAVTLGETVRTGDLEATVVEVDLDATDAVIAASDFADPPAAGNRYVLITVRVRHAGEGDETVQVSSSDFKITGSRNVLYDGFNEHSCGFIDGELNDELFASGEAEGLLCFQIPDDETDLILVLEPFFTFEDEDRRFLAVE